MRFSVFLVIVLGLVGVGVAAGLNSFNHFNKIEHAFAGRCEPVRGVPGPEDIQIDTRHSRAFISSLDRRVDGARGAIHIFDLNDPLAAGGWRDRTNGAPEDFWPYGLDYYEDGAVRRLFVVNAANAAVEMFDVLENGDLEHLETFAERRLNSPNNVVAVGPRSFYVTNDVKPGRNTLLASLHFLFRTGSGEVLYTDGTVWRVVADGLRFANGVDVSLDYRRLYVAETAGGAVRVFDREASTGSLSPAHIIKLEASPDNISVDDAGILWAASLPKPLLAPRLASNPEARVPSEIWRIRDGEKPQSIYRDNGDEISASTSAAHFGQALLIGAHYEDKFLLCDLPAPKTEARTNP